MHDHVARLHQRKQSGRDRGHAAGKEQGILRLFPDRQPVLGNFLIRPIEARIDETLGATGSDSRYTFKMPLAGRRTFEGEGGRQEDRRLQRALGQGRIIAMAHHQGCGLQFATLDLHDRLLGSAAVMGRFRPSKVGFGFAGHR